MNRQGFRIVFVVLILVGWSIRAEAEPAHWNVDPEHSTVEFRVAHMVVSKTTGILPTTKAISTWMPRPEP